MHGTMLMSLFGCRFARANNQIRAVAYGIRKAQEAADIPTGRVLSTVNTMPTRWGNQYKQIERNNTLKPVLDDVLDKWKLENRGKKDAFFTPDGEEIFREQRGKVALWEKPLFHLKPVSSLVLPSLVTTSCL